MMSAVKKLLAARHRLATQLYAALSFTGLVTITAILVAWQSFDRIDETQRRVNEESFPEMVSAFGIAQTSGSLVAAAPRLTSAPTREDLEIVIAEVSDVRREFEKQLGDLMQFDLGEGSIRVDQYSSELIENIDAIEASMRELLGVRVRSVEFRTQLAEMEKQVRMDLLPEVDAQFFYSVTGYTELDAEPDPKDVHLSVPEIDRYRHLTNLEKGANVAVQLLATSVIINDQAQLEPLREQFESAFDGIQSSLERLNEPDVEDRVSPLFEKLEDLGFGPGNGFEIRDMEIELENRQRELLQNNRLIAVELVNNVELLVGAVSESVADASQATQRAVQTTRTLLLALGFGGLAGALMIAWLFVGRFLLRRLEALSTRMRGMARGELEEAVDMSGRDEIAEMASALEIFRRHALQVQRLGLVENLANELQEKNATLETVLEDLKKAQNQIVMREKLAALGELTAGVAHEIKNPLNFVKNFSEASRELLEELEEVAEDETMDEEERKEEIESIHGLLNDNLKRILEHSGRANRIVHDMLRMGRGGGFQRTEINTLVDEHAKLAYHGARATTEGFNLTLKSEFDENAGRPEVISQDLGRVILNMVSNACYATHDKRLKLEEKMGSSQTGYSPELRLGTKREGDMVRITIRDNGSGMPPEVKDKIFNPFFTTKPTDQGTGLGLSLSNDIILQHGGSISVESKDGEFTEMTIMIPDSPPKELQGAT